MSNLNKYEAKIAPKDAKARSRIVPVEATNKDEARTILEGQYPAYEIFWIK